MNRSARTVRGWPEASRRPFEFKAAFIAELPFEFKAAFLAELPFEFKAAFLEE